MKTLNDEGDGAQLKRAPNYNARPIPKSELRKEDRQRAFERVEKSASLAITYPQLKALQVDLLYFDRQIVSWGHGLRYRANMETAKSLLHFNCPSSLCTGGGFDLSKDLSSAVAEHQKTVEGKVPCRGLRDQEAGKTAPCESSLHFKMNLTFKTKASPGRRKTARKSVTTPGRSRSH